MCAFIYLDSNKLLDVLLVVSATVRYASPGEYAHLDVIAGCPRKVVVGPRVDGWLLPAWHLVVNHLSSVQDVKIRRVRIQFLSKWLVSTIYHHHRRHHLVGTTNLSIDLVGNGDLDCFESIQNVELQSVRAL